MSTIVRYLLILFGTIFLMIGIVGLFIPVFPTMPFLIISGLCYINSSRKLYQWLIRMKYFGPHVKNYVEHRRILRKYKYYSLLFIWIPTLITILFIVRDWRYRFLSLFIAFIVSLHIISLKTIDDDGTSS
ncbi:MAG TPA: YbaN family protein [Haloplasmataceae bacterium]